MKHEEERGRINYQDHSIVALPTDFIQRIQSRTVITVAGRAEERLHLDSSCYCLPIMDGSPACKASGI